jgi:hypothetical protein
MSGNGEYYFDLPKNAVGTDGQPAKIDEGIILGGISWKILQFGV